MIKKTILIAALSIWVNTGKSQTLSDPIYFNYTQLDKTDFDKKAGNTTNNFIEFNATISPIKIGKKTSFFNAVYYRQSNFNYGNSFSQTGKFPDELYDIRYSAILRTQISHKWELVILPRLIIRSDLNQKLNQNDIFPQVVILGNYAIKGNPNFKIGLGVALNNDFERNAIIPIASLYYNSKKVKVEVAYPNINLIYKISENFEYGIFATFDGAISNVQAFKFENQNVNYFRTFQILVAPTASHRIYKNIFGHLKLGFVPVRNFKVMDSNFEVIQNQEFDVKSGFFFRTGISFRLNN